MGLKAWAISHIPLRYHVPLRYWYRFIRRRLEKELPILRHLISRGHVSLDIGANNGVYTYALSKLSSRVEAFEPVPACARTIAAFGAHNVRVHEVALSSSSGERELFVPQDSGVIHTSLASFTRPSGNCETVPVSVRRLDDYSFDDVSFVKIDVEGHELDVLKGARETIARSRPILLIEIEQRHISFPMESVFEEVLQFGYRGFFVARGRITPLAAFSSTVYQDPYVQNVLSPEYVNNFIFVDEASGLQRHLGS